MNIVLFEGDPFFPRGDERYDHIRKVLRKGVGDVFFAGIVDGAEGTAVIERMDDRGISFSFRPERSAPPLYPVILIVGFPRPIQLKRIFRDVASLGVERLLLCGTELGEKSYRESTIVDRGAARSALIDGAMQAGSSAVTKLELCDSALAAIAAVPARCSARVLLDIENPEFSLIDAPLGDPSAETPLALAIGSERGWTARERSAFREGGFRTCSLGSRILRTETACSAAVSIALAKAGFMEGSR